MVNEILMGWAIIERDHDGKGFSGISWHPTQEDATARVRYFVEVSARQHDDRVFYVVNREKYKHFQQLESSGLLYLN